jgi:hypothetical protein
MSDALQTKHNKLKSLINSLDWEVDRVCNKKIKSAHTKLRSQYMTAAKLISELRADVLAHQKQLAPRAKKKTDPEPPAEVAPEPEPQAEEEPVSEPEPAKPKRRGRKKRS